MIPGMGRGMNPHKMKRMMKQMGINIDEITDVEKIIIRTSDKEYIFGPDTAVSVMTAQGQKTFQIVGNPKIQPRTGGSDSEVSEERNVEDGMDGDESAQELIIPQEDVELVMSQTGASEDESRAALTACKGNPAEAILKLMEEK